ncbi:hypothetical protein CDAR_226231 [Caerostris darwini]|uniref:Uncharacterized protein n=1 Tax=Caerostris darwini TaxID=1538125 RepID=A0AAV4ULB8_9ARAC|nr:hypothetical protein CDAR_226231 [Caerostris darwini]
MPDHLSHELLRRNGRNWDTKLYVTQLNHQDFYRPTTASSSTSTTPGKAELQQLSNSSNYLWRIHVSKTSESCIHKTVAEELNLVWHVHQKVKSKKARRMGSK